MTTGRLEEFSLRGIYRVDQFFPFPGSICDLCVRDNASKNRSPAVCRQVEYGGNVPSSIERRPTQWVDPAGKPLAMTQSTEAVKNPLKRERGLCRRHMLLATEDALERGLIVLRFDKYNYSSVNELPPEWQEYYRLNIIQMPHSAGVRGRNN